MGPLLGAASRTLMKLLTPEKVYICSFGSGVKHGHFYLMPRPLDAPHDLVGGSFVAEVFTGRWACTDNDAADIARRLRGELAKHT